MDKPTGGEPVISSSSLGVCSVEISYLCTMINIEETINELYPEGFPPFMTNHKWVGEDGQKYSSWDISVPKDPNDPNSRSLMIHTGDGGAEMILKAMRDKINFKD